MRRLQTTMVLPALALLAGCSVLGLDEFDRCDEFGTTQGEFEQACADALNGSFGLPAACRPWRCLDGQCVRSDEEICDGADNDCDGNSDEGADPVSDIRRADLILGTPTGITFAEGATSVRALWTEADALAVVLPVSGELPAPVRANYVKNESNDVEAGPTEEPGCWGINRDGTGAMDTPITGIVPTEGNCNFAQLEVGMAGDSGIAASVSSARCVQGQLRIGHYEAGTEIFNLGPSGRSNAFAGVSLTHNGRCSAADTDRCEAAQLAVAFETQGCPTCAGSERCVRGACVPSTCASDAQCPHAQTCNGGRCEPQSCNSMSECDSPNAVQCLCGSCSSSAQVAISHACGVKDIALAALPGDQADVDVEAVVAAVSGSHALGRCITEDLSGTEEDESLHDVLVWGAHLQTAASNRIRFVNVSGEGEPTVLGQTRSTTAPGIAAIGETYAVASEQEGRLRIHLLAIPDARLVAAQMCEPAGDESQMCVSDTAAQPSVCGETSCGIEIGACVSGTFRCDGGEVYCDGAVMPQPELCANGVDEDCDGGVDETNCTDDCVPTTGDETGADMCNGLDDDCDGMTDENTEGDACGSSTGECSQGTWQCFAGRTICMGDVGPQPELCNGQDDDCNGILDNGCTEACVANPTEDCNGIDDDCDGTIDEGTPTTRDRRRPDSEPGNKESLTQTQRSPESIRQCLATDPLELVPGGDGPLPDAQIEDLVMAVGPASRDGVVMGVAWREISEMGQRIGFTSVTFHTECECAGGGGTCGVVGCDEVLTPTGVRAIAPVTHMSHREPLLGAPSLVYVPDGVLTLGTMRGDSVVEQPGGWRVVFAHLSTATEARLFMRTATVHDGEPARTTGCSECFPSAEEMCNNPCAVQLTQDSPPNARVSGAFSVDGQPRFAYTDPNNGVFVTGALTCPPR